MKDLVLVDPRSQRARLFQEAIAVYHRRVELLRDRAEQILSGAREEHERSRRLLDALNSVAARRCEPPNGDAVRLRVFETAPSAIDYLRRQDGPRRTVVFTDVYLLGSSGRALSGIELVESMKRDPGLRLIPTVLMCTDAPPEKVREAWRAGSSAVVHLPIELPGMLVRVADAVEFWFGTAAL